MCISPEGMEEEITISKVNPSTPREGRGRVPSPPGMGLRVVLQSRALFKCDPEQGRQERKGNGFRTKDREQALARKEGPAGQQASRRNRHTTHQQQLGRASPHPRAEKTNPVNSAHKGFL